MMFYFAYKHNKFNLYVQVLLYNKNILHYKLYLSNN